MKKKIITAFLMLTMFTACCSCSKESMEKAKEKRIAEKVEIARHGTSESPIRKIGTFKPDGSQSSITIYIKEIDNHEYLIIKNAKDDGIGICHYESCKYCKQN